MIYNLLLLSGFVLSGVTMFLLARALTGRTGAAMVGGAIFALYPYRLEHYSHLELQMTMWMPLALLWLHRTLARGRWRDGLATGLAFALQTLSSLYYGCFLAVFIAVVGGVVWLGRGRPRAPIAAAGRGSAARGRTRRAGGGRVHREPPDDGHARGRDDPVLQRRRVRTI